MRSSTPWRHDRSHAAFGWSVDLTREQRTFLADLRKGTCGATAAQDASVIGPLIRANLVRWDDNPSEAALPPQSSG
jgi:hypothetical protein